MTATTEQVHTPRGAQLATIRQVRIETAKIYRMARRGEMAVSDLTRFVYCLDRLARMLADETLESRILNLESESQQVIPGIFADNTGAENHVSEATSETSLQSETSGNQADSGQRLGQTDP